MLKLLLVYLNDKSLKVITLVVLYYYNCREHADYLLSVYM